MVKAIHRNPGKSAAAVCNRNCCLLNQLYFSGDTIHELLLSMVTAKAPVLASFIWIGGGSVGLIVLIVVIVLFLRS